MKTFRIAACLLWGSTSLLWAHTIKVPLEVNQDLTLVNFQSLRGVPLSSTNNTPVGSDGRVSTQVAQIADGLTANPPTQNQFQGMSFLGGIAGLTSNEWQLVKASTILSNGVTAFGGATAAEMKLPVAKSNNAVVLIMRRVQLGASFVSQASTLLIGSTIPVPMTDFKGLTLTNVVKESYWLAEPYSTNGHTNATYYWSPNAKGVFAIQAGGVRVTWVHSTPYTATTLPAYTNQAGTAGGIPSFVTNGASIYVLHTVNYVSSGAAVKPPRKIYWTEGEFRNLGKPIIIPKARVGGVRFVYNNNFTRTVATEYKSPGQTTIGEGTTNAPLAELRTIWHDTTQGAILAHNTEGRVFMELLGDARDDGSRTHLGFEIVDVIRNPVPADVTTELAEELLPPPPGTVEDLSPEPILQLQAEQFAVTHRITGSDRVSVYATRETSNLNDYQIHWMETSLQGVKWPSLQG